MKRSKRVFDLGGRHLFVCAVKSRALDRSHSDHRKRWSAGVLRLRADENAYDELQTNKVPDDESRGFG